MIQCLFLAKRVKITNFKEKIHVMIGDKFTLSVKAKSLFNRALYLISNVFDGNPGSRQR